MPKPTRVIGLLVGAALLLYGDAVGASGFDDAMRPILVEYLKIHRALASDRTEGIGPAIEAIETRAKALDPGSAPEDRADAYAEIRRDLSAACLAMKAATGMGPVRNAFKDLSRPVSAWVRLAGPEGAKVMYCPMAAARWVQEGSRVANPYYGSGMLECGREVAADEP